MSKAVIFRYLGAAFLLGVVFQSFTFWDIEWLLIFCLAGFLVLVFISLILFFQNSFQRYSAAIFICLVVILAFTTGNWRLMVYEKKTFRDWEEKAGQKIEVVGKVIREPVLSWETQRLVVETDEGLISCILPRGIEYQYGDILRLKGKVRIPENQSSFRWKDYLNKENIFAEMIFPDEELITSSSSFSFCGEISRRFSVWDGAAKEHARRDTSPLCGLGSSFFSQVLKGKRFFITALQKNIPEPQVSLLIGLLFGSRSGFPASLREDYRRAGLSHIIVVSGYHLSLIADTLIRLFQAIGLTMPFVFWFSLMTILLYTALAGFSPSVVRAAIMGGLILIAKVNSRLYNIKNALLGAAILMVWHNPKILRFDLGFQLSFLATLGLIYLYPYFSKIWKLENNSFLNWRQYFATTLAVIIFVLPWIFYQTGEISLIAPLANVLILPLIPLTMISGFLFAGGVAFFPFLSFFFSFLLYLLLEYQLRMVNFLTRWPGATIFLPPVFNWLIIPYYLALFYFLYSQAKNFFFKK